MKPCLVDVNVWLALAIRKHTHHGRALTWFDAAAPNVAGWNRVIQLSFMRLLCNSAIMGDAALTAAGAWNVIAQTAEDERVVMVEEPASLEIVFPTLLRYPVPTSKLVSDAYLAAVAISAEVRLVTLDRGFRQYRGLDLLLL